MNKMTKATNIKTCHRIRLRASKSTLNFKRVVFHAIGVRIITFG